MVTDTARPPQTHRQDRLQYTAPLATAQCINNNKAFIIKISIATCYTITPCSHLPTFIGDKIFLSATCQSKHAERARARWKGVADLCNACNDWSTVKECRPTVQRDVGESPSFFRVSELPTFVGDILYQRQMSPTFL